MEEVIHLWYHYGGGKKSEKSSQVPQGIQSDGLMQRRWKFLKFVSSRKHGSTFPNWSKWRTRLSNHLRPVKCYSLSPWSGSLNDKFPLLIKKNISSKWNIRSIFFFKLQDNDRQCVHGIIGSSQLFHYFQTLKSCLSRIHTRGIRHSKMIEGCKTCEKTSFSHYFHILERKVLTRSLKFTPVLAPSLFFPSFFKRNESLYKFYFPLCCSTLSRRWWNPHLKWRLNRQKFEWKNLFPGEKKKK